MLRDALCADADEPSDVQRRWSGLLARIKMPQRRWSGVFARIETPQRLNSGQHGAGDQMPAAWLLGWHMMSLVRAVS